MSPDGSILPLGIGPLHNQSRVEGMRKHKFPNWVTGNDGEGATLTFTLWLTDPCVLPSGDLAPCKSKVFRRYITSWRMVLHHHIVSSPSWHPSCTFKRPFHQPHQVSSFQMVQYVIGPVDHMVIYRLSLSPLL